MSSAALRACTASPRGDVPAPPEAQGPGADEEGHLRTDGPFKASRHALNFWILPVFWLMPRMTARLLLFNLLVTLYTYPASWHEAARLREAYGKGYADYERSGTPFLVPWG